jgi:hypothetical protein
MTTMTEAPALRAAGETTIDAHRVVFSDPDAVKATAVRDLASPATLVPLFSSRD